MVNIPSPLIDTLHAAQRITVLTGAGISAESGVPTFRDAQTGLWARYRPEELATPEAFQRHPKLVWDWYAWRRELVAGVKPNAAHHALVKLEKQVTDFILITQNVDGLHRRAGSRNVLELHGELFRTKCSRCEKAVSRWQDGGEAPPVCGHCYAWLRPDVVWFGEMLPVNLLQEAEAAAAQCEVFFSIGTSSLVYPAAELPLTALRGGATVVEINPQPTPLSDYVAYTLQGAAGKVLPALLKAVWDNEVQ